MLEYWENYHNLTNYRAMLENFANGYKDLHSKKVFKSVLITRVVGTAKVAAELRCTARCPVHRSKA